MTFVTWNKNNFHGSDDYFILILTGSSMISNPKSHKLHGLGKWEKGE